MFIIHVHEQIVRCTVELHVTIILTHPSHLKEVFQFLSTIYYLFFKCHFNTQYVVVFKNVYFYMCFERIKMRRNVFCF